MHKKEGHFCSRLKHKKMPTLQLSISEAELTCLNYERYHYPDPLILPRLHALYLKGKHGWSAEAIAKVVGAHSNTVLFWFKVYRCDGYQGLLENNYGTRKSALEEHSERILSLFQSSPPRSAAEAALQIKELTGIERSPQQVRAYMKRHGLRFIKCGHVPAKADPEAQQQWLQEKLTPAIEAAHREEKHLLFMDAAHFTLSPFICFLWSFARVFLRASAGRNRINVLGAVNALTKELTTLINDTYINAEVIKTFLSQLRQRYDDTKPIALVLDNARYQHCQAVKAVAASLNIELLYLPPYSPNLNLIERIWKFTKKQILNAQYYDKPAHFHQAIREFFENINQKHHQKLQTLLTLKFQTFQKPIPLI